MDFTFVEHCVQASVWNDPHDDVIKWNYFPRYWPLLRESTGHRWIPLTEASDVFFDLRLNKRLNKQSRTRRFDTPSRSLWRHWYDSYSFHCCSPLIKLTTVFYLFFVVVWSSSISPIFFGVTSRILGQSNLAYQIPSDSTVCLTVCLD